MLLKTTCCMAGTMQRSLNPPDPVRETGQTPTRKYASRTARPQRTIRFLLVLSPLPKGHSTHAACHTAMPKAAKNTVFARNEVTYRSERIKISKETRDKFANVCKRRKVPKPYNKPVVTPTLTLQERLDHTRDWAEHTARQQELSRLVMERRRLEDRISSPPPPLIERIAAPEYEPPAPIPEDIHFRKSWAILRIKEATKVFDGTREHLDPLFDKLKKEEARAVLGLAIRVSVELQEEMWKWVGPFLDVHDKLKEYGHELTKKEWRDLFGALKRIGKVKFDHLDSRLVEICEELVALKLTFPKLHA